MSDAAPSKPSFGLTLVAAIGGFVIFVVILLVVYLPKQPAPLGDGIKTPEQRKTALSELRANETKAATGYAWVDQAKGVVQLPLDRAVELTLRDIEAKQ
ncbi:MAG: hypothetical protein WC661_18965 [Opitutaceae bacterium]|jgi:hypothetical protein